MSVTLIRHFINLSSRTCCGTDKKLYIIPTSTFLCLQGTKRKRLQTSFNLMRFWEMFCSECENLTLLTKQGQFMQLISHFSFTPLLAQKTNLDLQKKWSNLTHSAIYIQLYYNKFNRVFRAICNGTYEGKGTKLGRDAIQVWGLNLPELKMSHCRPEIFPLSLVSAGKVWRQPAAFLSLIWPILT